MTNPDDEAVRRLQRSLSRIAGSEADQLIAEAIGDVRSRAADAVTRMLVERLVEKLDDVAGAEACQAGHTGSVDARKEVPGQIASGRRVHSEELELVYLYGLASSPPVLPEGLQGVGDRPPEVLPSAGVFGIVGRVPASIFLPEPLTEHLQDAAWVERSARAHDAVLRHAVRTAVVLPMRFGVVYSSPETLRSALATDRRRIDDAFAAFRGLDEWSVTAEAETTSMLLTFAAEGQATSGDMSQGVGSRYLHSRRAAFQMQKEGEVARDQCASECDRLLRAMAEDAALGRLPRRPARGETGPAREVILRASYLVTNEKAGLFTSAIRELERAFEALGLRIGLEGPLPPFHFVPRDLLAGSP